MHGMFLLSFFVVLTILLLAPVVVSLCSKNSQVKKFCAKIISIYGWIFSPLYPFLLIFSSLSRGAYFHINLGYRPILSAATWEGKRRRNFYLVVDLFIFFVFLACLFNFVRHYGNLFFDSGYPIISVLVFVYVIWIPPIISQKVLEKYEKSVTRKNYERKRND